MQNFKVKVTALVPGQRVELGTFTIRATSAFMAKAEATKKVTKPANTIELRFQVTGTR